MFRPFIFRSVVLLGILISTVLGQSPEKPKLDTVRKGTFTGRDRDATRAWVEQEIKNLFEAPDASKTIQQGAQLFFAADGLVPNYLAADANRAFQQGVAEIVATAFKAAYQAGPSDIAKRNPLAATYTLVALKAFNDPRVSLDCFTMALSDPFPGVRLVTLDGLRAIWEPLASPQKQVILGQLQTLAAKETDGATLSRMYAMLTQQPDQTRIRQTAESILKILDTRLADGERNGRPPLLADTEAIVWLGNNLDQFKNDPFYNSIVLTAARLLADVTESYVNEVHSPPREQELEVIIYQADEEMKKIAKAAPNAPPSTPDIARTMSRTPGAERKNKVRDELAGWIGDTSKKGYLNLAPFNLSSGLAQERVARATGEGVDQTGSTMTR